MVTGDTLAALFAELGPLDDEIVTVVQMADDAFAIRYEDLDVLGEWDGARSRLVLSATIGIPPEERLQRIYEVLLSYNMTWEATGGVHMGLNGPGGAAVQFVDLAGSELTARQVAIVSSNLAERTRIWQTFFEHDIEAEIDTAGGDVLESALTMLRI